MLLTSFLILLSSSELVLRSLARVKKINNALGRRDWCLVIHNGAMMPSGYRGESGVNGDSGE